MRRAALAAAAISLLTACGAHESAPVPRPTAWAPVGATLSGPLRPESANVCSRGDRRCLSLVIAEMNRRFDPLAAGCDHGAAFALMYLRVTEAVRGVRSGSTPFADDAFLNHLDAVFARLYFRAHDAWKGGDRDAVPRAWQIAFAAAEGKRVSGIGDLLLGMNAHISRDLPFAVASIGLRAGRTGAAERRSFEQVNDVLRDVAGPILREESRRFDPTIGAFALPVLATDERSLGALLGRWRDAALHDAQRLLRAPTSARRAAVAASIEENAAARAALIVAATSRVSFSRAGRDRDAFCRAHAGAAATARTGRPPREARRSAGSAS